MLDEPPRGGRDALDDPGGSASRPGVLDEPSPPPGAGHVFKRAAMAAATAFLAVNLWTGAPLLSLWVGSRVVGGTTLSMAAVFVVVGVLAVLVFAMAIALGWLNASYNRLTGRRSGSVRLAWLRSWNDQDEDLDDERELGVSALERIVVVSVYVAVIALLVWFFAFAGSPLPSP